jgi:hypothetical protein
VGIFLAFHTDQATLLRLLGGGFHSVTRRKFLEGSPTPGGTAESLPPWWTPLAGHSTKFLFSSGFHPSYARGEAYAAYDPVTQQASVYWDGID